MRLHTLLSLIPLAASFGSNGASARRHHKRACSSPDTNSGASPANTSTAIEVGHSGFDYNNTKIRGVNLGGWLILESFIAPTLFANTGNDQIVDEWTFCQDQDRATAEAALKQHWDTFVTEDDFVQIAAAGLDHVRIPVGYWSWDVQDDEPFIQGAAEYLDKAIVWARAHNIKVMIDLHGVPGSQNGYDHSGRQGAVNWYTDPKNVKRTVDIVQHLAIQYGSPEYSDTVTMFELLNKPTLWYGEEIQNVTKQFYLDAYDVARRPWGSEAGNKTNWIIVFHDGFQRMNWWDNYMIGDQYEKVWIDDHYYQAFDERYMEISAEEHLRELCGQVANYGSSPFPSISGEWSIGVANCAAAEWTSPMGPVGTCELSAPNFAQDYATFVRAYFDLQAQLYEKVGQGRGWFYFNWKTEDYAEWSYQLAMQNGWFPKSKEAPQFNLTTICAAA